jgi:hypothetical protein
MKSVLDVEVSCFKSYAGKEPKLVNLLTWLSSDKYADQVRELRTIENKDRRDEIKASLPAITVSGVFDPVRKEENLINHSGLICIDIDPKGNEQIKNFGGLKEQLFNIKNVAYAGLSASGKGFFLIIPIAYPKRHKQHFRAIQRDFLSFGIIIDTAPQNVASLRGYSFDQGALFRHNALPYRKWTRPVEGRSKSPLKKFTPSMNEIGTRGRVEAIITEIATRGIDITQEEPDWFRLACSFANEFGEGGRGYFHTISQYYPKYDYCEVDKKYDHALKGRYKSISIGTFFKMANDALI